MAINKITLPEENYNVPDYDEKLANKTNEIVEEVNRQENDINNTPETITNTNGTYYKFPSGLLICTKIENGNAIINIAMGAVYREDAARTWTFPHPFVEEPAVTNESVAGQQSSYTSAIYPTRLVYRMTGYYSSNNPSQFKTTLIAIGRWK